MALRHSLRALQLALRQLDWRTLRLGRGRCPLCAGRLFVRFSDDPLGTRCVSCQASAISMAIGAVLDRVAPDAADRRILELSTRGPFHDHLARSVAGGAGELVSCEYYDDVDPGAYRDGIQCQDVQRLSYPDASFGLCTSTEVFEHVPDDRRGFAEIFRVLEPGGLFVFTVPLSDEATTAERARLENGRIEHLEEPAYHDDFIRGAGQVLVYRDYGQDITVRLQAVGFTDTRIEASTDPAGFGCVAPVVVARRPQDAGAAR